MFTPFPPGFCPFPGFPPRSSEQNLGVSIDLKTFLLGLSILRGLVYLVAIPLAPFLYEDHFLVLVLLRPTKEVFLAAGFALRRGDIGFVELAAAAIPLSLLGVWLFYFLAAAYRHEIRNEKLNGRVLGRILPARKVNALGKILKKKGKRFVVLGRLAVLGSTMVAAAAGTLGMKRSDFLPADAAGALLSFALTVAAGYGLGETYERAGPWLTGLAALALVGSGLLLARYLKRS